jgi:hypothetical protein
VPGKFQPVKRDTADLLPPSLQDWLPEEHPARFVVDIVGQLDFSERVKCYGGSGKQPYHPAVDGFVHATNAKAAVDIDTH